MSTVAANQGRTLLQLLAELSPHIRADRNLPGRIQQRLAKERRFGSRDRRLYRELLYAAVRYWPWIEQVSARGEEAMLQAIVWLAAPLPSLEPLRAGVLATLGPTPRQMADKAAVLKVDASLLPAWVAEQCPSAAESPNLETLHERAPLWLRLQNDGALEQVVEEFGQRGWVAERSRHVLGALRLKTEADVTQTSAFQYGSIEVQDIGSQWVLHSTFAELPLAARSGRWLDACAGAGGKTLQLASLLGTQGAVVAHDIRKEALAELQARATRARMGNISISQRPEGLYDGVLVDAPCTGTGTWRRSPHLKWCTTRDSLGKASHLQLQLLSDFSHRVRHGGHLIYATCSLAAAENEGVVEAFLRTHSAFEAVDVQDRLGAEKRSVGHRLWPATLDSDGFYAAVLVRS